MILCCVIVTLDDDINDGDDLDNDDGDDDDASVYVKSVPDKADTRMTSKVRERMTQMTLLS